MVHIVFGLSILFCMPFFNKKMLGYIISMLLLFFFLAIRFDYGNDYMDYYQIFNYIHEGKQSYGQSDILYKFLNKVFPNFYLFIGIISLFYIFIIFELIRRNLNFKQIWFAIVILLINPYLFLIHLSSLRQTIAILFTIIALHFLYEKKFIKFFCFILIAAGFHKSALIILPFLFIVFVKRINILLLILIVLSLLFLVLNNGFEFLIEIGIKYFPDYSSYVEQGARNSIYNLLISCVFFTIIIVNINKLKGKQFYYSLLGLISTIFSILTYKLSMLMRIGMYFEIYLVISLPIIVMSVKNKIFRFLIIIFVLLIYGYRYFSFFTDPLWIEKYSDYHTIITSNFP